MWRVALLVLNYLFKFQRHRYTHLYTYLIVFPITYHSLPYHIYYTYPSVVPYIVFLCQSSNIGLSFSHAVEGPPQNVF